MPITHISATWPFPSAIESYFRWLDYAEKSMCTDAGGRGGDRFTQNAESYRKTGRNRDALAVAQHIVIIEKSAMLSRAQEYCQNICREMPSCRYKMLD